MYTIFGGQSYQFYCVIFVTLYLVTPRTLLGPNVYKYQLCHDFRPYEIKRYTDGFHSLKCLFYFPLSIHLGIRISSLYSLCPNGWHLFLLLEPNSTVRSLWYRMELCTLSSVQVINYPPTLFKSFLFSGNPFTSTYQYAVSSPQRNKKILSQCDIPLYSSFIFPSDIGQAS